MESKRWVVFDPISEAWEKSLCSKGCPHVQEEISEEFPGAILRSCELGFRMFPRNRCRFYEGTKRKEPAYKRDRPWIVVRIPDSSWIDRLISLAQKDDRSLNWELRQAMEEYLERRERETD